MTTQTKKRILTVVSVFLCVSMLVFLLGESELSLFLRQVVLQGFGLTIVALSVIFILAHNEWKTHGVSVAISFGTLMLGVLVMGYVTYGLPSGFNLPAFQHSYGPGSGPTLPFESVISFFKSLDDFERVSDIAYNPDVTVPAGIADSYREGEVVEVLLETKEVIAEMADGVTFNYWTFNGQVPGPFIRVHEGDTVKLTLKNALTSLHHHNIDLHAVTGPGGGAVVTTVPPGEERTFTFKALHPGVYVYHCAHPNVPNHMTHGMYGLIVVEPKGGFPPVDKEFYVMQGEFYSTSKLGTRGLQVFDPQKMLDGTPDYVVFNGRTGGVTGKMHAEVGDTVRIFFGNGGVNLVSSFHVIGEVFDRVYPEGAVGGETHENVQTTLVPAGGATIVEFGVQYPGKYILVDHALARLDKGAWGVLEVTGERDPSIFDGDFSTPSEGH